jgi:dTDP-glucose pyrophosphorylase
VPKPLLPLNGRPILDYTLGALAQAGVTDVCLVTHYLASQIEAFVADGSTWGMRACYRRQSTIRGTAHALQTAADFITTPCFVVAADYALPAHYLQVLKDTYRNSDAQLAVSLKRLPVAELHNRSSVRCEPLPGSSADGRFRILEIVEKPAPGSAPGHIGASLLYVVPPATGRYLQQLTLSSRGEYELQTVVNQMLDDGYQMVGCLQPPPPEWTKPV